MHLIARKTVAAFVKRYPKSKAFLTAWVKVVAKADWRSIDDVRAVYAHADPVKVASGSVVTVFNVCGNDYRLVVAIHYNRQKVYVLRLMTHAEYDKGRWKGQL